MGDMSKVKHTTRNTAAYVVLIVLAVILINLFGFRGMRFFMVSSSSMEPTLNTADMIVVLKQKVYKRGDIVVLRDEREGDGSYIVKRIVAISGDSVSIKNGVLSINGQYVSEPYIKEQMEYKMESPVHVGPGEVFVMGDNRNNSADSSLWQESLKVDSIEGKARYVYYPFSRKGPVKSYPLAVATSN